MKFSTALIDKYTRATSNLFDKLYKMHELWYKINGLETKYSDIAERYQERFKAEFFDISSHVVQNLIEDYEAWLFDHTKDGWWERFKDIIEMQLSESPRDGLQIEIGGGYVDLNDCIVPHINDYISKDTDFAQEFIESEDDYGAHEYLQERLEINEDILTNEYDIIDDADAWKYMGEHYMLKDFYEYKAKKGEAPTEESFDIRELYGDKWIHIIDHSTIFRMLEECKDEVWDQWLDIWPGYEEVFEIVKKSVNDLESVENSRDINEIMRVVSLALNVAHNNGQMYEHTELSEKEFEKLSNLDTSEWDKQLGVFSKKVRGTVRT